MPDVKPIEDYHKHDRFDDEGNTIEKCPICGTLLDIRWHDDEVYDSDGTEYDHIMETDPGDGPFYCPECWKQYQVTRARHLHATLDQYEKQSDSTGKKEQHGNWTYYE